MKQRDMAAVVDEGAATGVLNSQRANRQRQGEQTSHEEQIEGRLLQR